MHTPVSPAQHESPESQSFQRMHEKRKCLHFLHPLVLDRGVGRSPPRSITPADLAEGLPAICAANRDRPLNTDQSDLKPLQKGGLGDLAR